MMMMRDVLFLFFMAMLVFAMSVLIILPARAHVAQSGWAYPATCCSDKDCRESKVKETTGGYKVPSGEIVVYQDERLRDSPDGVFHWCSANGHPFGKTICLFVPPRSF